MRTRTTAEPVNHRFPYQWHRLSPPGQVAPSGLMSHQQPLLTSWAALLGSDIGFMSLHFTAAGRSGHPDTCHSTPSIEIKKDNRVFLFLFLSRYVRVVKKTSGPLCRPRSIVGPLLAHLSVIAAPPVFCVAGFLLQTLQLGRKNYFFQNSCVNWSLTFSFSGSPAEPSIDLFCLSFVCTPHHINSRENDDKMKYPETINLRFHGS